MLLTNVYNRDPDFGLDDMKGSSKSLNFPSKQRMAFYEDETEKNFALTSYINQIIYFHSQAGFFTFLDKLFAIGCLATIKDFWFIN